MIEETLKPDDLYLNAEKYFQSGEKNSIMDEVSREIAEECDAAVLDADQIRYQEDWSYLSSRIVGAEGN